MSKYSNLVVFQSLFRKRFTNFSIKQKFRNLYDFYEDFIGVKEVRKTQEAVLKSESEFVESTKARRSVQNQMLGLQEQLKQIRHKLDSTLRSDESYLDLITKEHQLIRNEIQVIDSLRSIEESERHLFSKFSATLRDAHEVERLRQEKTKYLSVIGSIIGASLGIIATSINQAMKRKDFKQLVQMIENQNNSQKHNLALNVAAPELPKEEKRIFGNKCSVETQTNVRNDDKIVECIANTESNLEFKMKVNCLTTVVTTYALIAITLPIIIRIFSN